MPKQSKQSQTKLRKMRVTKEMMSLEDYLQFVDSQKQLDLTVKLLNEIILMHGFKRIHKTPKKVLIDAIDAIDLIDPARSTLEKQTSLPETAKLEEVISDLNDLNWQECCVTSIQTLNNYKEDLPDGAENQNLKVFSVSASGKTARKVKKAKKPKAAWTAVYYKCLDCGGCSTHAPPGPVAKRKREVSEEGDCGNVSSLC